MTDVVVEGISESELLALVAAVEQESEHPLAAAVVRHAQERGAPVLAASDFLNVPGHGAGATVDGHRVLVATADLWPTKESIWARWPRCAMNLPTPDGPQCSSPSTARPRR
ncbi:hypothetical protein [Pseudarthrobacter raffinosi]|uniref:hypothetical protein n=1 Tax=Pseudarthrobacter raffinosi TaxID=2953651 RepID=UPI00208F5772|nr:hypothetical protein [Pseudarthrobacter sp. MDT3-28]MCO4239744.1 hypothetical protein [Pseudarthrobacter sp. MDT3-28]